MSLRRRNRIKKIIMSITTLSASLLILFFITALLSGSNMIAFGDSFGTVKPVEITTYNPYSLQVFLEVKCDWDNKNKKYRYIRLFTVPGKSQVVMKVPRIYEKCQIWPKIKFF